MVKKMVNDMTWRVGAKRVYNFRNASEHFKFDDDS